MKNNNYISLGKAIEFHGHLGPWLVLGLVAGKYIVKKLKARRHFGLAIETCGLNKKPKTCLLDGLQLSTGCTMGKTNLSSTNSSFIKITGLNKDTKKKVTVRFKKHVLELLNAVGDHKTSEKIAKNFYKMSPKELII